LEKLIQLTFVTNLNLARLLDSPNLGDVIFPTYQGEISYPSPNLTLAQVDQPCPPCPRLDRGSDSPLGCCRRGGDRGGSGSKRSQGRVDYILRVKVTSEAQPVAVALIEAKTENLPPGHGLEQGKLYAESKRLNVLFVIATNGHQFVLYDRITGITDKPKPMMEIPMPAKLRAAYESGMEFSLDSDSPPFKYDQGMMIFLFGDGGDLVCKIQRISVIL